jgi:hypothetical protein
MSPYLVSENVTPRPFVQQAPRAHHGKIQGTLGITRSEIVR